MQFGVGLMLVLLATLTKEIVYFRVLNTATLN
jgi:hypothetical protein